MVFVQGGCLCFTESFSEALLFVLPICIQKPRKVCITTKSKVFNQLYSIMFFSHVSQPVLESKAWAPALDRRPLQKTQEIAGGSIGSLERALISAFIQSAGNF